MSRYICIHGHFYQPPRENPWLEEIELQESAYPFHDWNARINSECYKVNGMSRMLDDDGRIIEITNNYADISFNFGPTLLAWMEQHAPGTYERIIEADRLSMERYGGHGSAIAQAYNHMIMPLANHRDRITQVRWGIEDFRHRFGREPEGMWLAETAVDLETLDVLAEHGIKYTILAPNQAARTRPLDDKTWQSVEDHHVDATMPYVQKLPSGRSIAIFFYDGPISQALAFEHLLNSGRAFADRLRDALPDENEQPCLMHIATDGESYGHHHRHGDMALAAALSHLKNDDSVQLTNYGQFLELHPPTHEVEIIENTAWSCVHGVERWNSDCGCHSGANPEWNQAWRRPLRASLDWLRDELAPRYEEHAAKLFKDPWAARDEYISVVLDRSDENVDAFLDRHAKRKLKAPDRLTALKLLELQRNLMLMYTSCGWFFDDLGGIETVQIIQYAGRAVQLARQLFKTDPEQPFLDRLDKAESNLPENGSGRQIFEKMVRPAMVELQTVGAHYAISSLFEEYQDRDRIFCYDVDVEEYKIHDSGRARLAVGRVEIASRITRESAMLSFGVLHLGDHNLLGTVRSFRDRSAYEDMVRDLEEAFRRADVAESIRRLDKHFGEHRYTVTTIFRDEQRRVLDQILDSTMAEVEAAYRHVYDDHVTLIRALSGMNIPIPGVLRTTAEFIVNLDLQRAFEDPDMDIPFVYSMIEDTGPWGLKLDIDGLSFALQQSTERAAQRAADQPDDIDQLQRLNEIVGLARNLPFEVDLWNTQNIYYDLLRHHYPDRKIAPGNGENQKWIEQFESLGEQLRVAVEPVMEPVAE